MKKLILASETNVTFDQGKIIIKSPYGEPYITNEINVLLLLHRFSLNPYTIDEGIKAFNEVLSNEQLANIKLQIEKLQTCRILKPHYYSHEDFFKILNKKRESMDFLKYDDWGMTVSNCGKENLSPGCQSCKDGRWICVFPGFTCNVACEFCPRLTKEMIAKPPMNMETLNHLLETLDKNSDKISGISISGGELFFDNYNISKELIKQCKKRYPHIYLWAYTNGKAATLDYMQELRDIGLDELRFNLAATDFNKSIINNIRDHAVKIFPWVTVEIPIYDKSFDYLINRGRLKELVDIGIKQLNLAEIRVSSIEANSNEDKSPAEKNFLNTEQLYEFNYMSFKLLSVVNSRLYTYDIFEYADRENLDIRINDCSQEAKFLQIMSRTVRGLEKISKDLDVFSNY